MRKLSPPSLTSNPPHLSFCGLQLQILSTADLQRPLGSAHFHPSGSLHGQGPCWRLQSEEKKEKRALVHELINYFCLYFQDVCITETLTFSTI